MTKPPQHLSVLHKIRSQVVLNLPSNIFQLILLTLLCLDYVYSLEWHCKYTLTMCKNKYGPLHHKRLKQFLIEINQILKDMRSWYFQTQYMTCSTFLQVLNSEQKPSFFLIPQKGRNSSVCSLINLIKLRFLLCACLTT